MDGEGAKEASQPSPRSTLVWPRKESRKEERRRERNSSSSEWTSSSEFRSRRMGDSEEERKAVNLAPRDLKEAATPPWTISR